MKTRTSMLKRVVAATAISAALLVGLAAPSMAFVPPYVPTFPDVPTTHPFYIEIEWLASESITTGYDDGTFKPAAGTTRQALAAFLYRYEVGGQAPLCTAKPFSDVDLGNAFCGEITWGKNEGIIQGYPDGTFKPTNTVNRQATAAYLYRLAGAPNGPDPTCATAPFSDVPTTHAFCGEIAWGKSSGIIDGYPDNTFRPTDPVTRQAFAAFLYRYDFMVGGSSVSALGAAGAAGAAGTDGSGDNPPATGADPADSPEATPTAVITGGSGATLPVTGGNVGTVAVLGILLAGGGTLLVVGTRRRRDGLTTPS